MGPNTDREFPPFPRDGVGGATLAPPRTSKNALVGRNDPLRRADRCEASASLSLLPKDAFIVVVKVAVNGCLSLPQWSFPGFTFDEA